MLIFVAAALALVSWMLWMQLGSQGVPLARVRRLLIELWLSFAAIIGLFWFGRWAIGYVPRRANPADEIQGWWTRLTALPLWAQIMLVLALLLALGLLARVMWTLSNLRRQYEAPDDVGTEDS
ncbi:MAG: hypothetical protein BWY76_02931 [bacterium ADurb.Bin429]|nr:MAG: hypothetical protein BWY76_02931 [bacterium ADurb.Bin429]